MTGRSNTCSGKGPRRSRTGCITCKIRRVKCDETRPACHRCTSTGRTCDGYPAAGVPSQHSTRRALATAVRQLQVVGPAARVLGKPLPVDDVACFDFFRVCTASMTGSVFPGEKFWSMQMLQAAHAEPAVWKAAVALGALHRRWEFSNYCLNPDVTRRPGPQRDNTDALQFTDQALKHYTSSLSLAKSISDPNILAILSVALGAAAHLAGRWADSQVHIQAGLRILREMGTQLRPSDLEGAAQALERLDAQAMTLSDATSPYEYTPSVLEESKQILLKNSDTGDHSVDHNLSALLGPMNDLGQAALAIFRLMRQFFIVADAVTTGGITPGEFEQARIQMVKATSRWEKQLALLLDLHESKSKFAGDGAHNKRDQKVLLLSLRLYQTTVELLLFAHGTPPEQFPDMSHFVEKQDPDSPDMMDLDLGSTNIPRTIFPQEALVKEGRGLDSAVPCDEAMSAQHAALDSHTGHPFAPETVSPGGFPLPAPLASSTTTQSRENTPPFTKNGYGSGSWPDTNLGPPGFCANRGYLSSLSPARSHMSSTSKSATAASGPPQIQPKAPLAPSSPSPVLVLSRSPSPFTSALPSPRLNPTPSPGPTFFQPQPNSLFGNTPDVLSPDLFHDQPHLHDPEPSPDPGEGIQIPTSETRWDCLHGHFVLIVALASQIAANTDSPLPFFMSLEPGLAMPLYFTAKRCRHPITRRKALGLLRRLNRQEGIWNCALAARAAEEVILLEEGGLFESWSEDGLAAAGEDAADGNKRGGGLLLPLDIFERVEDGDDNSGKIKGLLEHYRAIAMEKATEAVMRGHVKDASGCGSREQERFWPDGWPSIPEEKRILVQYPIFKLEENKLELLMFVMGDMRDAEEQRGRMAKRVVVDLF